VLLSCPSYPTAEETEVLRVKELVQELETSFETVTWGWGQGGEMTQALYAHMNNKRKNKRKKL
jgi:hypothetical protein